MTKKAVLAGCNYPGTDAELHGCVNDVRRMHDCLVRRLGFHKHDIVVLVDSDHHRSLEEFPTGLNIKEALHDMVSTAAAGDILFFHYSGHGTRLPSETGDHDDTGYDECIVPCDMNLITDADFRDIVDRVPQGVSFTILADSCHSGGLLQNAKEQIGHSCTKSTTCKPKRKRKQTEGSSSRNHLTTAHQDDDHDDDAKYQPIPHSLPGTLKNRALPFSTLLNILQQKKPGITVGNIQNMLFETFGEEASIKVKKYIKKGDIAAGKGTQAINKQFVQQKKASENTGILLSSCQSREVSADANPSGDPKQAFGAMSDAVLTVLSENQQHGKRKWINITHDELVTRATLLLEKGGFTQHPGLYCSDALVSSPFLFHKGKRSC